MFASWFGLTAYRRMNGAAKKSRRQKGRTALHLEILEDRWVPSTATGTNAGEIAGNIQSQSYLLNSPAMSSAQAQLTASPQILSSNVNPYVEPTVNWTPSGSTLPSATQFVSYSTDISAAPSSGSSTLSVGIDPTSAEQLNSIGLTAVVTPGGEGTPGKVTIQGIPTNFGDYSVTVVAYREPTEPLDTKTYTLSIAPGGSVITSQITASVSPNSVNAGSSVSVSANVTNVSDGSNLTGGSVTFTLTGASGTSLKSNPVTVTNGVATTTLTIPSTEPSGDFNLTANYSGVSGSIAPVSATINNALTVNNTGVSILGNITPTTLTASTVDQNVTANATVENNNSPIVGGTVTFNLLNSSGTPVTGTTPIDGVTNNNGTASVTLIVPANTAAATYTVTATYNNQTATVGTLVINAVEAGATVTLTPPASITESASNQVVNLSATVTQSGGSGNLGSVQFQVMSGTTPIASNTAAVGSNGVATAAVTIPGGTPAGTYNVLATFTGRGETTATATGTLTINSTPPPSPPPSPPPPPPSGSTTSSGFPIDVLIQIAADVQAIPNWSNPESIATLESILGTAFSMASAQSSEQATSLFFDEFNLALDLRMAANNPFLLAMSNNQSANSLANSIHDNPLYHTLAGWIMANAEMERLLVG